MQIVLGQVGKGGGGRDPVEALCLSYLERCSAFAQYEMVNFRDENALFERVNRQKTRVLPRIVLLDSRGRQMTSESFAEWLGRQRDDGIQQILFVIGPADGWSDESRKRANLLLSLGPMTLAHALARLVVAEQIYRAFTILTGHPYHSGH